MRRTRGRPDRFHSGNSKASPPGGRACARASSATVCAAGTALRRWRVRSAVSSSIMSWMRSRELEPIVERSPAPISRPGRICGYVLDRRSTRCRAPRPRSPTPQSRRASVCRARGPRQRPARPHRKRLGCADAFRASRWRLDDGLGGRAVIRSPAPRGPIRARLFSAPTTADSRHAGTAFSTRSTSSGINIEPVGRRRSLLLAPENLQPLLGIEFADIAGMQPALGIATRRPFAP